MTDRQLTALLLAGLTGLAATLPAHAETAPATESAPEAVTPAAVADVPSSMPATLAPLAVAPDADGFLNPLDSLRFLPKESLDAFEQATLGALAVSDPWESLNRRVYHFNQRVDEKVVMPVIRGYRFVTPRVVRQGVNNFWDNFTDVGNLANSLLQLKPKRSLQTTGRLLVNTTVGVLGLWDPATRIGLQRQDEDFGQTLGHYGVPAGPYVMLPGLGPSSARDAGGRLVDWVGMDQINYINISRNSSEYPALLALRLINARDATPFSFGQLNSPFEYEKLRYIFTQARVLQVRD